MKKLLERNWLGFLKNGWRDTGPVSRTYQGDSLYNTQVCNYCKDEIHVYTKRGGSKCKACPRCLEAAEVFLDNIEL